MTEVTSTECEVYSRRSCPRFEGVPCLKMSDGDSNVEPLLPLVQLNGRDHLQVEGQLTTDVDQLEAVSSGQMGVYVTKPFILSSTVSIAFGQDYRHLR